MIPTIRDCFFCIERTENCKNYTHSLNKDVCHWYLIMHEDLSRYRNDPNAITTFDLKSFFHPDMQVIKQVVEFGVME